MGRPDYDDVTAGGNEEPSATQCDTTGWLQHGQDPDDVEYRDS